MSLLPIRAGERRAAWAAFLTLFALIASHAVLETARDALFLASIPAAHLPWVSLAIAVLSLATLELQSTPRFEPRRALSLLTAAAGLITLGFFALHHTLGSAGLYALYVWSGLLTTTVLIQFWGLVGELFTITQAKRLYGFIGAGSVLGAIAGSGLAGLISALAGPRSLLLVAGLGFLVASLVPLAFGRPPPGARTGDAAPALPETLRYVLHDPYARRVAATLFVATVCLAVADYVFKSTVAAHVPEAELGAFLGTSYFAINVLSLVCQLALTGWILRRASLGSSLAVLPVLLVGAGLGVVATGGLAAVLAVRAADGALRYSLHRTAAELLFLPFGDEARRRVKAFADVVGQRGGQVLAALLVLGLGAIHAAPPIVAAVLVLLAALWALSALALRKPYVELFRARLKAGRTPHVGEFPELDVASLETLIATLESENDPEVLAALDILERENKAHLVPVFILLHPSEAVVVRTLGILTRSGRKNGVRLIDRVLDHPSPRVRAAAIAARSVLAPDAHRLRMRLATEASPEVRATIMVNLIAAGELAGRERDEGLEALLQHGTPGTLVALAEAIAHRSATGFESVLIALAEHADTDVRRAALGALAAVSAVDPVHRAALLGAIVRALADEATRGVAESILAGQGDAAVSVLLARFDDATTPTALRWRIPHALGLCSPERAAAALLARLPRERDGSVRFQIIRQLERLVRRDPRLALDKRALAASIDETMSRAFRSLDRRLLLVRGAAQDAARLTPGHLLLVALLRDKETNALGRLFRLLGLLHPADDFAQIHRGLSGDPDARATSIELLESILEEPLRSAVRALVDDVEDEARLERAGPYHERLALDYPALIEHLCAGESEAVREVAAFHARELHKVVAPRPVAPREEVR